MFVSVPHMAAIVALALATPALAQDSAADPEVGSLVCELAGDCAAPSAAVPTPKGARTSSTRGFTFKRTAPAPNGTPGTEASAGARVAGSAMAAAPSGTAMPRMGAANLRLDFASGSATLTPGARARLNKLAAALSTPRLTGRRMRIEGHTDASGSAAANRDLSQRRAQSAADYLVSMGVDQARLEVVGYGSSRVLPGVAPTSANNRRVMAVVLN